ncbi:hypothetical protein SprV_0401531800 [Sparganum proliferum]
MNKTIGKLRKAGALTRREALAANASDAAMARFYGPPKVHKPGVPLPPHRLPTWYPNLWAVKVAEWTVKSAEEFLSRIKRLEVEADEVMVSFDLIRSFTSIPPALAIDTIDGFLREKYDETDQQLPRQFAFGSAEHLGAVKVERVIVFQTVHGDMRSNILSPYG